MSACVIDGCDKPVFGHGWCSKHYTRWRRHGDPTKKHRTRTEEFWRRVDPVDEPNPRPTRKSPERRCRACSRAATARSLAKKKETIQ